MRAAALILLALTPAYAGYQEGMDARKRGDLPAARAEFEKMLND